MHIGFITDEYVSPKWLGGGLANYLKKTGYALTQRGHTVSVFLLADRTCEWQDGAVTVYELKRTAFPFNGHRIPFLTSGMPVAMQIMCSRKLRRKILEVHKKTTIDILHTSNLGGVGYSMLNNGEIPIVCRGSSYRPASRGAFGAKRNLAAFLCDWLELRLVIDADASFGPSELLASFFRRFEGHDLKVLRTPVSELPLNLDESFYLEHLAGKRYLLFVGTLNRLKGIDLIADLIPRVCEKHPQLQFVFVGRDGGMSKAVSSLEYLCLHAGSHREKIHYFEPIEKQKLLTVIQHSVGVIMPSRVDNYPNACLEALQLGVPVVGCYNSSLEEMIVDGASGFLAQNGDAVSIEAAIYRLLNMSVEERKGMQDNIAQAVQAILSEQRLEQLIEFYENIVTRFRTKRIAA